MGYLFYSRRAKVLTVVCWLVIIPNIVNETVRLFLSETTGDLLLLHLITTFRVPRFCVYIIKAIFVILYFLAMVSWAFPQAMNCIFCSVQVVDLYLKSISEVQMLSLLFSTSFYSLYGAHTFLQAMNYLVMSLLYDQFNVLYKELGKCIGDGGEFSGNFEQFRRRHQAISRSVQEADRFLMISNVAAFCCQIVSIILVLYSAIFFRHETVSMSLEYAFGYMYWLGINVIVLCLAASLPIIVNHAVSLCTISMILWSCKTAIMIMPLTNIAIISI